MSQSVQKSRIGELLIKNGTITQSQLDRAIFEQGLRRNAWSHADGQTRTVPVLGEILVELGYINAKQLKRTLNWQHKLRKASLTLTLLTPLLHPTWAYGAMAQNSDNSAGAFRQDARIAQEDGTAPSEVVN